MMLTWAQLAAAALLNIGTIYCLKTSEGMVRFWPTRSRQSYQRSGCSHTAARWLYETALHPYPDSKYARSHIPG